MFVRSSSTRGSSSDPISEFEYKEKGSTPMWVVVVRLEGREDDMETATATTAGGGGEWKGGFYGICSVSVL